MARLLMILSIAVLLHAVTARPPTSEMLTSGYSFDAYLQDFGKDTPVGDDYVRRQQQFAKELASVLRHNADSAQLYRQGLNQFSDWSVEEKATMLMAPGRDSFMRSNRDAGGLRSADLARVAVASDARPLRPQLDYRRADPPVLSAVKDQGRCGSCWSFATTEAIEAHTAIQTGTLFSLSMQQIVSCVPNVTMVIADVPPSNQSITQIMHACNGYIPTLAVDYIVSNQSGRMSQEWEIPYQSYWAQNLPDTSAYKPTPACMNSAGRTFTTVNVTGYKQPPANAQTEIENALFSAGPLVTVISVPQSFMAYESGVYAGSECIGYDLMTPAHAVQIVGYGHDATLKVDYWIVRNSWAPIWGEKGYIRMLRTAPTECGEMWLPTDGNSLYLTRQKACGTCGLLAWTMFPTVN
jgi:cathepsin L